ncbi:MAG: cytochrome c peroxidase [Bacteroidota bacterium]|nr:cytochrome c peroxidase [Bacteroidota bacterium]
MKNKISIFILIPVLLSAFMQMKMRLFETPANWPKPQYDFSKNPLTEEKIELGRALFYDPILSKNNTISCASCHSQYTAFTHVDHALSHGIEDRIGTRNSPALMNLAWQKIFMWDGAINHLDVQALGPISNHLEMDEKIENVVAKLQSSKIYPQLFLEAFGDSVITGQHTLKAISQFMLTLVSKDSKYDSVMRKQAAFSSQETNGYKLFQKNCGNCHKEPLFTNGEFENNGLTVDTLLNDYGRVSISKDPNDSLKFKVPTLRNVEFSMPYMHDGRFKKLKQVLDHYTDGVQTSKTLSPHLQQQIKLTSNEKVDLIAFMLTLTDKKFLFDQNYSYPKHILLSSRKK